MLVLHTKSYTFKNVEEYNGECDDTHQIYD